jgi:hypothetical protein
MVEQRILDSFQTMWGPFPEPVMLIHKSRTILAVNDFASKIGIPAGSKCFSLNPEVGPADDHCSRCKANLALRTGETVCTEETMGERRIIGYWMPLKEVPDVYVHFGIGTAGAMTGAQSSPAPCDLVNP